MIRDAAEGNERGRAAFANQYLEAVQAYLRARWSGSQMIRFTDDAAQDVFLECFRENGPLNRVKENRPSSFRAYLYGLARNIARRFEDRGVRDANRQGPSISKLDVATDEPSLSQVFDRAWARMIMKQAGDRHRHLANQSGEAAIRRVELLELRFQQGLPIRHIADQWQVDPAKLHRQYAKAREEFRLALVYVVGLHRPGSPGEIDEEVKALFKLLS